MAYPTEVLADSPSAYMRLGDASGGCVDAVGGAAGTYTNAPTLGAASLLASDPANTSVSFDGSNDHVSFADRAAFDRGDTFTLEAWIYMTAIGRNNGIVDKGSGAYVFRVTTANRLLLRRNGTGDIVTSTTTLAANTLYHVVATKTGSTVKLYINGVDVTGTVTNQTCANNSNAFNIAAADGGTGDFFQGRIDEVAIYPTALSAGRVLAHYTAGVTPPPPDPPAAVTGSATGVDHDSATLNGTVDPNGSATTYFFEYGETTGYGTSIPVGEDGSAGSGGSPGAVDEVISGLDPETTYHFRLVAVNAGGTDEGDDATFTTDPAPDETAPATSIDSGPDDPTTETTATFTFSADEIGCTFEGQLDGGGWEAITSPHEIADLEFGEHTFEVRATDAAENTDLSPAEWAWTVEEEAAAPENVMAGQVDTFELAGKLIGGRGRR